MPALEVFIQSLKIGNIYWFINPKISSSESHPHVCLGTKDDTCAFMLCGTSQFEKKKRFFELNGLPFETLVRFQANVTNTITKDTYINCNEVQSHQIIDLYNNSSFKQRGNVSHSELFQIKNGIEISELLEEEFKDLILREFPEF